MPTFLSKYQNDVMKITHFLTEEEGCQIYF